MENHIVAIVFWLFVGAVAMTGIIVDYKKRQASLAPLRAAIERGQQLDPVLIERLIGPEGSSEINPLYLTIAGYIVISAGVGVGILAFFLAQVAAVALYPVLGGGIVALCLGVGLILAARAVERAQGARARTPDGAREVRAP